ncbi:sensor histidine kinase [Zavarzinia sp. CC-PAN008]|uniref:sensor histidine kinase n=1 Tax=Zavarzinia sp. CC-PAN008 TaxID=3243332 RepID=UPI003F7496BE
MTGTPGTPLGKRPAAAPVVPAEAGRARPTAGTPGFPRPFRFLDSLRGRMMALVVTALLPTTAFSLIMAQQGIAEQRAQVHQSVRQVAALAANSQSALLESTRKLLTLLAAVPDAQDASPACTMLLARALDSHPEYANIFTVTRDGLLPCSALPAPAETRVTDAWLGEVQETRTLTVSPYVIGRVSQQPVLVASLPLPPGGAAIAIAASIRTAWLEGPRLSSIIPPEGRLDILDRNGRIMLPQTTPEAAPAAAVALRPPIDVEQMRAGTMPRLFEAPDESGAARTYAVEPLAGGAAFIVYSVPTAVLMDAIDRDLLARLMGLAVLWLTVIAGAWFGARALVTRWTQDLTAVAHSMSDGQLDERTPDMAGAPRELRELGDTLAGMARRISLRDQELHHSIVAREALIREIHHRVKNNLQMITSLLSLQSRALKSEPAKRVLADIEIRIRALALVHRQLYEGDDMKSVNLRAFMGDLCQLIQDTAKESGERIRLGLDVPPLLVVSEKAVPLALLVTEALTNAFAHGFPDGRTGQVMVRIDAPDVGELLLSVTDDGIGMPAAALDGTSLGTSLMRAFAKQLGGVLDVRGPPGTRVEVRFPALGFEDAA